MDEMVLGVALVLLIDIVLLLFLILIYYSFWQKEDDYRDARACSYQPSYNYAGNYAMDHRKKSRREDRRVRTVVPEVDHLGFLELTDQMTGKRIWKDFYGRIILGRWRNEPAATENFYVGSSQSISRRQCAVTKTEQGMVATNLSRINVSMLNGEPLTEPKMLRQGDFLTFGDRDYIISAMGERS